MCSQARLAVFVPPFLALPGLAARLWLQARGVDVVSFDGPSVAEPESKSHARALGLLSGSRRPGQVSTLVISGNGKRDYVSTRYRLSIYLVAGDDTLVVVGCAPSSRFNSFSIFIFSLRPFFLVSGPSGLPQHLSLRIPHMAYFIHHRHHHRTHTHISAPAIMSYDYAMT